MGVPGLFSYLRKYNKNGDAQSTIKSKLPNPSEAVHLYLDFNGAIYQVIKPEITTEETLIIHICAYLDNLVSIYDTQVYDPVSDSFGVVECSVKKLFIAIDGVPPRAKMEQQRQRRFHSVCRRDKTAKIDAKYGTEYDKSSQNMHLDTNMITPGTVFMEKLRKALAAHIDQTEKYRCMEVVFSDWACPGEGEHKIFAHMRETPPPAEGIKNIIYGLDGDLIMLSLASRVPNLYLVREAYEYGQYAFEHEGFPYLFMDVNCLKVALVRECANKRLAPMESITPFEIARFIDDYVVLMMLLGNDFMPKIPWIGIRQNGGEILLSAYFETQNGIENNVNGYVDDNPLTSKSNLVRDEAACEAKWLFNRSTGRINMLMLRDVFSNLARRENGLVIKYMEERQRKHIPIPRESTERERQQIMMDFLPLQYLEIESDIRPRTQGWRQRYYAICHETHATDANISKICDAYLRTLIWNANYYIGRLLSWDWYFPYHYPPTLADVSQHIMEMKSHSHIQWPASQPVGPHTLLLMVLPEYSAGLMAGSVASAVRAGDGQLSVFFPKSYEINLALHTRYYECTPKIPKISVKFADAFVAKCKLTDAEKERSRPGELRTWPTVDQAN